ncbi:solute carrier organic anion transporter family member 2B1 isoform X2 [Electrophorus electricus]|uniref:Solute carrier organic anion transporter family member n=1 Tax=Electrophorus electricus TaxID=8005 RepID=A0A4W4GXE4_ELEEL|nr:solute carrier organic anion transporter family member 2B1 isoform X2 [Electrophorus electricus]
MGLFNNIKFFVLCHGMLQLAQLLVSGYLKGSISTIEKRYGLSSQMSGLLSSFNEVGNTVLIVFVSYFGSRVHRPRCIGIGAIIASMAAFLIALPHFFSGEYEYTDDQNSTKVNVSGLCQPVSTVQAQLFNKTCSKEDSHAHHAVYPVLLLGQLLLGIGGVPIQPFGISYVDDYAYKKNSPFYLGILFSITVIGPALGYLMASFMLRLYVDFNLDSSDSINLTKDDPRWVGAWWMGFLLAGTLLFLTSLPYLFFPRKMQTEETTEAPVKPTSEKFIKKNDMSSNQMHELSLSQFLKRFPHIMLRTLRNPIYLLVVLAQVNLAAMIAGIATFMPKFIERHFMKPATFSNLMIGGLIIPSAMLGIMAGGMVLRRLSLSIRASAVMCIVAVLMGSMFALPLLFLGCSTQRIAGIYPNKSQQCSLDCSCSSEAFNPVCSSDDIEFRSPCHAGCRQGSYDEKMKVWNYTDCSCVGSNSLPGFTLSRICDNGCSHLIIPFLILSSLSCLLVSFSHTPSFMMILRTVAPEDKSFALGIQFMLFRVLAFLPAPVLYGSAIDSTCILWGQKCNKNTSCHYYNLDLFRQRFLGLQNFFIVGGLAFFVLSFLVLKRMDSIRQLQTEQGSNVATGKKDQETSLQKAASVPL